MAFVVPKGLQSQLRILNLPDALISDDPIEPPLFLCGPRGGTARPLTAIRPDGDLRHSDDHMTPTTKARRQKPKPHGIQTQVYGGHFQEARNRAVQEPSQDSPGESSKIGLDDVVSLVGVKAVARKLPERSLARELILEMDDSMPRWMALGQLLTIDRILCKDLAHWH